MEHIDLSFGKGGSGTMANCYGGARIGTGQKKKALADKLTEGDPSRRKLTVMEFSDTAILEAEAGLERDGKLYEARKALASLKRKHFG